MPVDDASEVNDDSGEDGISARVGAAMTSLLEGLSLNAESGVYTVLPGGRAVVVPRQVAVAGLHALGRAVPAHVEHGLAMTLLADGSDTH